MNPADFEAAARDRMADFIAALVELVKVDAAMRSAR